MNPSILELFIVIAILVVVFTVLMKYFKWALNGVIIFILALVLLYVVLRVLDYSDSTGAIGSLLNEIKEALGLNDPQTTNNVKELSNTVVETT
jgi:membrane protein implicated in regulation of membrane protease activity